jgi:hypothetical protein
MPLVVGGVVVVVIAVVATAVAFVMTRPARDDAVVAVACHRPRVDRFDIWHCCTRRADIADRTNDLSE